MSDIHLDCANELSRWYFFERLRMAEFDAAVLTGDVSIADQLEGHLREIAQACAPRPVFFVTGNHDYFGASIEEVDRMLARLCADLEGLVFLGNGEVVMLGDNTALIGHRGWADGRGGRGVETAIESSDHERIEDFKKLPNRACRFAKMAALGAESASYFQSLLPYCLTWASHVLISTHVPPFAQAALYRDRQCDADHLPHFSNVSAGSVFGHFAKRTKCRMTVLSGHTHFSAEVQFAGTLTIRVAGATRGEPEFELLKCS